VIRAWIKRALLDALGAVTGRHAVLLPRAAARDEALLDVSAPYRVEGARLTVAVREPSPGRLRVALLGYQGSFPRRPLWRSPPLDYRGPSALTLDLDGGAVEWDGAPLGRAPLPDGRRFALRLRLDGKDRVARARTTGHYRAGARRPIDADYYRGDVYADHEAQSEAPRIVELLRRHGARPPLLEVGCATGGLLAALDGARFGDSFGVDVSAWAIARATERLGPGRAFASDPERAPLPEALAARGPFATLVLWAVLEHFASPFDALAALSAHAAPGALLVVNTANADGLARFLHGRDWEGHFDWSHAGVESVGARSLRETLPRLGWRIVSLATDQVWDASPDDAHAALRDAWHADARFRRLLAERDLGDFVTCVARRE